MGSMNNLAMALEREAKQREEQAQILLAEAKTLRESTAALEHRLKTEPDIQIPEGTRKEQLVWIINNALGGKASRSEINTTAVKAGIPLGTIASMLGSKNHKRLFKQADGKWFVANGVSHQVAPAQMQQAHQPNAELVAQQ